MSLFCSIPIILIPIPILKFILAGRDHTILCHLILFETFKNKKEFHASAAESSTASSLQV